MKTLADMIKPDETFIWDKKEIEKELPGFTFTGPGWYIRPEATMLVMPGERAEDYLFWIFYGRDPRPAFHVFSQLPIQLDQAPAAVLLDTSDPKMGKRIYFLGTWMLFLIALVVGVRWGLLAELPIILGLIIWTTYIRRALNK